MTPIYCSAHGKLNGARQNTRICVCGKAHPTYGKKGDARPSCCKSCKTDVMIDLRDNKCKECSVRASYGLVGGKMEYCAAHRKSDMIDLVNKLCESPGCKTIAQFGTEYKKARFCETHKTDGLRAVNHKPCIHAGCLARPSYGTVWRKALYCVDHKKEGMKNVVTIRCATEGCGSMPTFGIEKGKATHCNAHKTSDMVDVKHTYCKADGCNIRPSYGIEKNKPIYCKLHKEDDMVDVTSKLCDISGCSLHANFGITIGKPLRCLKHKDVNMVDVTHEQLRCPGPPEQKGADGRCPVEQRGTPKYDGFCTICFPIAFPSDPRAFTIKKNSDELIVRDFLAMNFPDLGFFHDTPLWTHNCECTHRRRIDLRTIIEGTMLAVEIDEHQHKYKEAKDEEIRYDDVFMLHSGKWIFIRYNPHTYLDNDKKRKNPAKDLRLATLKTVVLEQISRIHKNENHGLLEIQYLYFDEVSV